MSAWFWAWLFGWQVYGLVLVDNPTLMDISVSYAVALFWPVHLPARLLKMVLR